MAHPGNSVISAPEGGREGELALGRGDLSTGEGREGELALGRKVHRHGGHGGHCWPDRAGRVKGPYLVLVIE